METIDEKLEINKELSKKDIAAILVTLVGQLSAIKANADPKTSMYTAYIQKALQESGAKEAVAKLKAELPAYTNGVKFQVNESKNFKY